ncbi:trypsin-like peptidase domain-containing protein [Sinorhizobium meliloti]|uniref:trypsin-like peptidase domain-containing protein n=1 Tax=Rhizobium meliloti TaxID=382 RepID=UPI000FD9ADE0|nr:trypsin-like peptidase domain-containing protein [Sinorhizobium meliloti]RVK33826.1 hypothetical protein CN163_23160 [Sinorhizobium meliloti]
MRWNGQVYLCYDPRDGDWLAERLRVDLERGTPNIHCNSASISADPDIAAEEMAAAIDRCACFIYIATPLSLAAGTPAAMARKCALDYKKPIVVVQAGDKRPSGRFARRPVVPVGLGQVPSTDALRLLIMGTVTLEGQLQSAQSYLADAREMLEHAQNENEAERARRMVEEWEQRADALEEALSDPDRVRQQQAKRVEAGIELERREPSKVQPSRSIGERRTFGKLPVPVTRFFQDRELQSRAISDFLKNESSRILLVTGRGGVGKSAMVCRLFDAFKRGELPDGLGRIAVDGTILLSFKTGFLPTAGNLRLALVELASDKDRARLEALLGRSPWSETPLAQALALFSGSRYAAPIPILLDNMEDGLDPDNGKVLDRDLATFLAALAEADDCILKVVMTSRLEAKELLHLSPAVFTYLPLDDGLPSPYAEELLRSLDNVGTFGLRDASAIRLGELRTYTRGFPRALEAVFSLLMTGAQLDEIGGHSLADDRVVEALVGEALRRLADMDQLVIVVLAVFGQPVPPTAVNSVLGQWFAHIDASRVLVRLTEMRFVQRVSDRYTLHPIDASNAIRALQERSWPTGRRDPFSGDAATETVSLETVQEAAADFYESIQRDRRQWKSMSDVEAHIGEFKLRIDLKDEWAAAHILDELQDFFDKQGAFKPLADLAVQLEKIAGGTYTKGVALRCLASSAWRQGRRKDAVTYQERLISECSADSDTNRANLAIYSFADGKYLSALVEFEGYEKNNLKVKAPTKDKITIKYWLSECKSKLGYFDDAIRLVRIALELAEDLGELDTIEAQKHNLASACEDLNKVDEARNLLNEAMIIAETNGNPLWKANHLGLLASLTYKDGDQAAALRNIDQAIAIREEIVDLDGLASNLFSKARWRMLADDLDGARSIAARARDTDTTSSGIEQEAASVFAQLAMLRSDWHEAAQLLRRVLAAPTDGATFHTRARLGCCLLGLQRRDEASEVFDAAAQQARLWIERCGENAEAWEGLGLALAGSSIITPASQQDAVEAYMKARQRDARPGVIATRLHDFRLLERACPSVEFGSILQAITGVTPSSTKLPSDPIPALANQQRKSPRNLGDTTDQAHRDREALAEVIARRGGSSTDLVDASNLPQNLRYELKGKISGNPLVSARTIIKTLLDYGTERLGGDTALGSLLVALTPQLGIEDLAFVAPLLLSYGLIGSQNQAEFCSRYQLPQPPDAQLPAHFGNVHFTVDPAADDPTLQTWLAREPDFLDMSTLRLAVKRARSVCRIEVPALRASGTGVLLGEDLVLTNYHVLDGNGSAPNNNAEGTVVRFGAFTDGSASAEDGQTLTLHRDAVVEHSATRELDFVLLRTAKRATLLTDVTPIQLTADMPTARGDLHILQHPEGGPMKLALSNNSVVVVNEDNGKVQYATRTAGGSSGAPCFDKNWQMVALHRAEVARTFGSVREGVLAARILEKVARHLG